MAFLTTNGNQIHTKRLRQMAFPILMSAGKVQYCRHLTRSISLFPWCVHLSKRIEQIAQMQFDSLILDGLHFQNFTFVAQPWQKTAVFLGAHGSIPNFQGYGWWLLAVIWDYTGDIESIYPSKKCREAMNIAIHFHKAGGHDTSRRRERVDQACH